MINSVNFPSLTNASQKVAFKSASVLNEQTATKKPMSTTTKAMLGATALAATVVAGLLVHKGIQVNKLNKLINELKSSLQNRIRLNGINDHSGRSLNDLFDNEILQKHIDDAAKLPKNEQIAKLRELSIINDPRQIPSDISVLPREIQEAVASKDQFKAMKAYTQYCDTLFDKSKTAGATVAESIENVFGKNSGIRPHTYNPADEAEYICGYIDKGGYKDLAINAQNQIAQDTNHSSLRIIDPHVKFDAGHVFTEGSIIQKAIYNGKTYVKINIPNGRSGDYLLFVSKNGKELTPVQKDLLSLQGKLTEKDLKLFEEMLSNYGPDRQPIVLTKDFKDGYNHLSMLNYETILSTIQTLVEKYKPYNPLQK